MRLPESSARFRRISRGQRSEGVLLLGQRILVMGLGRFGGGAGVTAWLVSQGARVTVTDQASAQSLAETVRSITHLPIGLRLGGHHPNDLENTDLVVVNPAVVKDRSEFFQEIERRRIPWTTEMNMFCERCPATVIGVTGTYGKSTTCAMLAAALEDFVAAGSTPITGVHLGGNIGKSLLNELNRIRDSDVVVLEMSNAQLEDIPRISWRPYVAVITNLWPHHLDRHGSLEAYARAKFNIIGSPLQTPIVVAGDMHDDARELLLAVLQESPRQVCLHVEAHDPPDALRVPGPHNRRNADCVMTICDALQLPEDLVRESLHRFAGLEHRIELVATIGGVAYVNDSKSTSPSATMVALECFEGPVVAIVGGRRKPVSLDSCANLLAARCKAVICLGESGPDFADAIGQSARQRRRATDFVREAQSLEEGVRTAAEFCEPGDTVLFSPGAPSFDGYVNFCERGAAFKRIVEMLSSSRDRAGMQRPITNQIRGRL